MDRNAQKQQVLDYVSDLVSDFLYYDRKEDEDLPVGEIERRIELGIVTVEEIADQFEAQIRSNV